MHILIRQQGIFAMTPCLILSFLNRVTNCEIRVIWNFLASFLHARTICKSQKISISQDYVGINSLAQRMKFKWVMLDVTPSQSMHYCIVLLCEVYCVIV